MPKLKLCLPTSSGGHLTQLYNLKDWWSQYDRFWVTFDKVDARSLLAGERIYYAYYPTNRNITNLLRNTVLAWRILRKEQPQLIFSTGAGVAVPFFYVGKFLGAHLVFLETLDPIDAPSLTGKLVQPVVNQFLVQWEEKKAFYPKAEYWGQAF